MAVHEVPGMVGPSLMAVWRSLVTRPLAHHGREHLHSPRFAKSFTCLSLARIILGSLFPELKTEKLGGALIFQLRMKCSNNFEMLPRLLIVLTQQICWINSVPVQFTNGSKPFTSFVENIKQNSTAKCN